MSNCTIISGTLEAKLRNKLFAYFHQRYVELVYVESQDDGDASSGHYEMRLYKDKNRTTSSLYSFIINPVSMTCYINYLNSKKHSFTFVCSSQQNSICFSAHTKYERDAWLAVLEQLQWQSQPDISKLKAAESQEMSQSNTTVTTGSRSSSQLKALDDDDLSYHSNDEHDHGPSTANKTISYIISLTQQHMSNDNSYYYNYYNSNLYNREGDHSHNNKQTQCSCNSCDGQKFTILGLLNDEYGKTSHHCHHIGPLETNTTIQCMQSMQSNLL
eukprot:427025_1